MNVLLIDADAGPWDNLALLTIAEGHHRRGDKVYLQNPSIDPDLVYISSMFDWSGPVARGISKWYDCEVIIGGTGIDITSSIPEEFQRLPPHYPIAKHQRSLGRTTMGCIRNCPFCIVRQKEGCLKRWMHPEEFYNPDWKEIHLLDNNLLGDKDWFFTVSQWIIDHDLKLHDGGMDIRLVDDEIAEQLTRIKHHGPLTFAWDHPRDEDKVRRGIQHLRDAGDNGKYLFYVLINYNTSMDQDRHRIDVLESLNCRPYVMLYDEKNADPIYNQLRRWCNFNQIRKSCAFEKFDRLTIKQKITISECCRVRKCECEHAYRYTPEEYENATIIKCKGCGSTNVEWLYKKRMT